MEEDELDEDELVESPQRKRFRMIGGLILASIVVLFALQNFLIPVNFELVPLVQYEVVDGDLKDSTSLSLDEAPYQDRLTVFQDDGKKHEMIWEYLTELLPPDVTASIATFQLDSDGKNEGIAYVKRNKDDPSKWLLSVDIDDAYLGNELNSSALAETLIHEMAHVITLGPDQIDLEIEVDLGDSNEGITEELNELALAACAPQYFSGDGCALPESYLNLFYQEFWLDLFDEYDQIQYIQDDQDYQDALTRFYNQNSERFITEYASEGAEEDIADSFMTFVLEDRPENTSSEADRKIEFFYQFPQLVEYRDHILTNLD